jgi:hypothetical protein
VAELSGASDADLREAMRGTAMARAKVGGLRRNLAVALENTRNDGTRNNGTRNNGSVRL